MVEPPVAREPGVKGPAEAVARQGEVSACPAGSKESAGLEHHVRCDYIASLAEARGDDTIDAELSIQGPIRIEPGQGEVAGREVAGRSPCGDDLPVGLNDDRVGAGPLRIREPDRRPAIAGEGRVEISILVVAGHGEVT